MRSGTPTRARQKCLIWFQRFFSSFLYSFEPYILITSTIHISEKLISCTNYFPPVHVQSTPHHEYQSVKHLLNIMKMTREVYNILSRHNYNLTCRVNIEVKGKEKFLEKFKKIRTYDSDQKSFALTLYLYGHKAYDYLWTNGLHLPHFRTLRK
ncbi:hypothetical protein HELRODRAFT_174467 [Helobdella robusta]|uniref:THAP9-like helix-turn-helix domain-containing protein n=1 Tax=Helobdella robusta TaxID=6412 RepID=T1F855_HELRO|nr:hypothetical protein HELRODRAFT_174467 [Helobdella robusta]ESO01511.1 hypothetical protein HELRODRAFT_174467 [Helobdella robusta]